jgi:HAMP domain-containing protein
MIFFSIATLTARLRPLKGITRFADAIGHGEMDAKLSNYAVYQRNDEIGVLQKSIERMLDAINRFTIQAYRLELANRVSQLKIFRRRSTPTYYTIPHASHQFVGRKEKCSPTRVTALAR